MHRIHNKEQAGNYLACQQLMDMCLCVNGELILSCAPHCAVLLNQSAMCGFTTNDRFATQANILPYPSIQNSATSSKPQDVNGSTDKRLNQTWRDASSSWGLRWIEHSSMNQTTNKVNDVTSGLSVLYLKGCASETNVIGQLPRTLCFPLSMVLHLKRQCGDRICREMLQQKTKWKRLPQCTSWQQPTVRGLNFTLCHWGAFAGKHYSQKYFCQDYLS